MNHMHIDLQLQLAAALAPTVGPNRLILFIYLKSQKFLSTNTASELLIVARIQRKEADQTAKADNKSPSSYNFSAVVIAAQSNYHFTQADPVTRVHQELFNVMDSSVIAAPYSNRNTTKA